MYKLYIENFDNKTYNLEIRSVSMDVKSIGVNKVVNLYSDKSKVQRIHKVEPKKDTLEISPLAKKLSSLDVDNFKIDRAEEVEIIRKKVKEGSYNVKSEDIAKKMLEVMKGRGV